MFSELSAVGKIIQQDLVDVQQHHHKHKLLLETLRKPIHDTKSEQGKLQFNSLLSEKNLYLKFMERSERIDEIKIIIGTSEHDDEKIKINHHHIHHHHDEENNDHHFFRMANIEKVSVLEDKIPKTSDYEPLSWACFGKCKKSRIDFLSRITNQEAFQATRLEQEFMGENVFIGFS